MGRDAEQPTLTVRSVPLCSEAGQKEAGLRGGAQGGLVPVSVAGRGAPLGVDVVVLWASSGSPP